MKTKFIFKIEYYHQDTNQIDVRVGRSTSKSINDCRKVSVDLNKLDLNDSESFANSLISSLAQNALERENKDDVPRDNIGEEISGELNIPDLVGKVVKGVYNYDKRELLKMRKIELWKDFLRSARISQFVLK